MQQAEQEIPKLFGRTTLQPLTLRMDSSDISVTSSDAYICRNIYAFIVAITRTMLTAAHGYIGKSNCSLLLRSRKLKSLLHFSKFLVNANFDFVTNYILREIN